MSLLKRFYNDPYLHIRAFARDLAISATLCTGLLAVHSSEFYALNFAWWQLLLVPLGVYAGGMSAVFIHNATHHSFPNKWLNELCGYVAGMHQLWGFTGWRLIHLVHHQYSDQAGMDPHPPKGFGFWKFAQVMFLHSSAKISERYREHWGMSLRTRTLHRGVLALFGGLVIANLLFWFLLLGPMGFALFYLPSYIANHLLFVDINYSAHPVDESTGETRPANLDDTLYHKIANALWCGIYYHGNHHRKPLLFNPKHMPENQRREPLRSAA